MSKFVAENTKQLSVRIDDEDRRRIDKIRAYIKGTTDLEPQRSDVVRKVMSLGINQFCEKNNIDIDALMKEPDVAPTTAPSTTSKPSKKKAKAST